MCGFGSESIASMSDSSKEANRQSQPAKWVAHL
jgi:hypothetical protein